MASISIIGAGNIGSALARVFARSGVDAMIANTRGPGSFPELAAEVAPTAHAFLAEVTATPENVGFFGAKRVSFHALPVHRIRKGVPLPDIE